MIEITVVLITCLILLLPITSVGWRRARPVIAILALSFLLIPLTPATADNVNVRIRATLHSNDVAEGNEIHIEGVEFDGAQQDLFSLFPGNSWTLVENRLAWRMYDTGSQPIIYDQWPAAGEYRIHFQKSKWRGIAEVQVGEDIYTVDCYAPVEFGETEILTLPGPSGAAQLSKLAAYAASAVSLVLLCLLIPLLMRFSKPAQKDPGTVSRESWSDILRILAVFFIIILGVSGGIFAEYGLSYPSGINHMVLFIIASFAIPLFLMLTGSFLLHRDESPQNTLAKRAPSVFVPLVALIAISLLSSGYRAGGGLEAPLNYVASSLFSSYDAVPRFFLMLAALYIAAPVVRPVFTSAEKAVSFYAVCVVCILPGVIYTALSLLGVDGAPLTAAAIVSHIGQFILGAYMVTFKEKWSGKWSAPLFVVLTGFALSFAVRYFILLRGGYPRPTPFSAGIETTLLCGGMFALLMSLAPAIDGKMPHRLHRSIQYMSSLAIGTLMIHTILIHRLPRFSIGGFVFEINSKSIASSVGTGALYMLISLAVSYIISTIPVIKRLIGLDWYTAGNRNANTKH